MITAMEKHILPTKRMTWQIEVFDSGQCFKKNIISLKFCKIFIISVLTGLLKHPESGEKSSLFNKFK